MTDYFWFDALKQSIRKNKRLRENRYFQLATIAKDARPANRTVVFRGFTQTSNSIKVITDSRSKKLEEIKSNPACEICWYFNISREQFRIGAEAKIVDQSGSDERIKTWSELSDSAREQFFWPAPGKHIESSANESELNPAIHQEIPETFILLDLQPISVDHLRLKGSPQTRTLSSVESGDWISSEVYP